MKRSDTLLVIFGLTLLCMGMLVGWWTLFMREAVNLEREVTLSGIHVEALETAYAMGVAEGPPTLGAVQDNADLEVVRCAETDQELRFPTRPNHTDVCVQISADTVRTINERLRRRQAMVNGEGLFLFALLAVCTFMLYHLSRQERRHTKDMESFFHAATHEMKTPLTGIKTLLETLRAGRVPEEERAHLLKLGLNSAHQLEHRIENVLIAGGMKTGRQNAHITTLELLPLLEAFIDHRRKLLIGRPEDVRLADGPIDTTWAVSADPDLLRVVLENLVDNGLKYGGETPEVELSVTRAEGTVRIDVRDWGVGFDPAMSPTVFSPYRRGLERAKNIEHGSGIGLSIALNLCRKMGGDLKAHSDGPGQGATFSVHLPEARGEAHA